MPITELHTLFANPVSYALLALSAVIIGMSKMGFPGINIITTPLVIYLVQDVRVSIALALLLLYPGDILAVIHFKKSCNKKIFFMFIPYALAGVVIAGVVGILLSRTILLTIIAYFVLSFAVIMTIQELHSLFTRSSHMKRGTSPEIITFQKPSISKKIILAFLATLSGAASMLASASGPLTSLYLLTVRMDKKSFIGTGALLYITYNTVKLFILIFVWKVMTLPLFLYALTIIPWSIAGAYIARSISKNIPEHIYRWAIIALICAAGFILAFFSIL